MSTEGLRMWEHIHYLMSMRIVSSLTLEYDDIVKLIGIQLDNPIYFLCFSYDYKLVLSKIG